MSRLLLSTAYLPNIQYFRALAQNGGANVEQWESFPKQSFRNRCQILTEGGPMSLSIPVVKANSKQLTKDVRISYTENWQPKHWHAITSAYNSSPYFEYFRDDFQPFYTKKFEFLIDYNTQLINLIMEILGMKAQISLTQDYMHGSGIISADSNIYDLRNIIHPKVEQSEGNNYYTQKPYPQVFDCKMPFAPNMSIIDMVFNIGEETMWYLRDK